MRSARQHKVDVALMKALSLSAPYIVPESILKADGARLVVPRATESELDDALRYHDSEKRLSSTAGETEMQWTLNDQGKIWLQQKS